MYYTDSAKIIAQDPEKNSFRVLDEQNGCVAGCCAGISFYPGLEYGKAGVHADQEGFYVIEGEGYAKFEDQEFPVYPGVSMIAPAGVHHSIKRNPDSVPVKVFWFHSAI